MYKVLRGTRPDHTDKPRYISSLPTAAEIARLYCEVGDYGYWCNVFNEKDDLIFAFKNSGGKVVKCDLTFTFLKAAGRVVKTNMKLEDAFDLAKLKSLVCRNGLIRHVNISGDRYATIFTGKKNDNNSALTAYHIWTDSRGAHVGRVNQQALPNPEARREITSCAKVTLYTTRRELEASR